MRTYIKPHIKPFRPIDQPDLLPLHISFRAPIDLAFTSSHIQPHLLPLQISFWAPIDNSNLRTYTCPLPFPHSQPNQFSQLESFIKSNTNTKLKSVIKSNTNTKLTSVIISNTNTKLKSVITSNPLPHTRTHYFPKYHFA